MVIFPDLGGQQQQAQDGRFILRSGDDDDAGVQADSSGTTLYSKRPTAPIATIFTSPLLGVSGVSNKKMITLIFKLIFFIFSIGKCNK